MDYLTPLTRNKHNIRYKKIFGLDKDATRLSEPIITMKFGGIEQWKK